MRSTRAPCGSQRRATPPTLDVVIVYVMFCLGTPVGVAHATIQQNVSVATVLTWYKLMGVKGFHADITLRAVVSLQIVVIESLLVVRAEGSQIGPTPAVRPPVRVQRVGVGTSQQPRAALGSRMPVSSRPRSMGRRCLRELPWGWLSASSIYGMQLRVCHRWLLGGRQRGQCGWRLSQPQRLLKGRRWERWGRLRSRHRRLLGGRRREMWS